MSLPAYKDYQASLAPWVEKAPAVWKQKRLKFVVDIVKDKVDSSAIDLPYMGLEHIEPWTGRYVEDESASADGVATHFLPDDVLFGKLRPYLAKVHHAKHEGVCSTEALVFRPREELDPAYLRYFCCTPDYIDIVNGSTYGAKMPRASWDFIGNMVQFLPSIEEQRAIVAFLDAKTAQVDALIAKKEALLTLLAEKRTALITNAVTKGLNSDAPMKPSGVEWLGDIPAHWEVKRLKFLTDKIGSGVTPRGGAETYLEAGNVAFLRSQNIHFNEIRL